MTKIKQHKWMNSHDLPYHYNDKNATCEICGMIRLRLTYLKSDENVVYYHPTSPNAITYKAPKCKKYKAPTTNSCPPVASASPSSPPVFHPSKRRVKLRRALLNGQSSKGKG